MSVNDVVETIRGVIRFIMPIIKIGVPLLFFYYSYIIIKYRAIKSLSYRRYFSVEGAFADEEAYLIEEVTNRSFLPLFNIEIESYVWPELKLDGYPTQEGEMQEFLSVFNLPPRSTVKRSHRFKCMERGCYVLESAGVWYRYDKVDIDSKASILIYPRQYTIEMQESLELYLQSMDDSQRPIIRDPFSFSGIREYQYGDSFHSINFKATAKQGFLCVNKTDFLTGKQLLLAMNFQQQGNGYEYEAYKKYMELGLSAAAYMLDMALLRGYRAGFAANCRMVNGNRYISYPISGGGVHFEEILKEMAKIRLVSGNSFASVLEMMIEEGITNTEVYVFTLYTDDRIDEKLDVIKAMGNTVNYVWLQEI